jgi:hypothetical protein
MRVGFAANPRAWAYSRNASLSFGSIASALSTMAFMLSGITTANTPPKKEKKRTPRRPRTRRSHRPTLSPTVALVVKLVAKADEADEVSTFLADAVRLANQEQGTIAWFALRTDTTTFWIVDAFPSDRERQARLGADRLVPAGQCRTTPGRATRDPPGRGPRRQVAPTSAASDDRPNQPPSPATGEDGPVAALNILREAAGLEPWPDTYRGRDSVYSSWPPGVDWGGSTGGYDTHQSCPFTLWWENDPWLRERFRRG